LLWVPWLVVDVVESGESERDEESLRVAIDAKRQQTANYETKMSGMHQRKATRKTVAEDKSL